MRWKVCGCVTSCCAAQELRGVRGPQEDVWVGERGAHLLQHICSQRIVHEELAGEYQPLRTRLGVLGVLLMQHALDISDRSVGQRHLQREVLI